MSKLTLDSVAWETFRIRDVFEVANSKPYHKDKLVLSNNGIEYVTRTSQNNGVEDIVSLERNYILNEDNSISLGAENADFFFHENKYLTGNKMYCIKNQYINKFNGLFLVNIFRNSIKGAGFGYGKGLTGTRFKTRYIVLPIDDNGNPNWQFMEDYIKEEMKAQSQKVIAYYENKLKKLGFELLDLEVEWKEFKVKDIFKFRKKISKGLSNLEKDKDGINYLGATNRNNGVLEFVKDNENMRYKGNCIAFIRNGEGSMGYAVYKREDFIATQDISVGYNENLDLYVGTFLTTIADRVRGKYNFGYKRNQNRLENEILHLPIKNDGSPHWEYMRQFMRKLEKENIEKVLSYLRIYND